MDKRIDRANAKLAGALDYLGSVAEFLMNNDFETNLADLEEARAIIRNTRNQLSLISASG